MQRARAARFSAILPVQSQQGLQRGTGAQELQRWPPTSRVSMGRAPTARQDPFRQLVSKFRFAKSQVPAVQQNAYVPQSSMPQTMLQQRSASPAFQNTYQAQASRFRFQTARDPRVAVQAPQQAFATNPAQPQALNYAQPSVSSQLAQAQGLRGAGTVAAAWGPTVSSSGAAFTSPMNAASGYTGVSPPYGHNPSTVLTGVHPVASPSGVAVPNSAVQRLAVPGLPANGLTALTQNIYSGAAGLVQPGMHPAVAQAGIYPAGAAGTIYSGAAGLVHPGMHPAVVQAGTYPAAVQAGLAHPGLLPFYAEAARKSGSESGSEAGGTYLPMLLVNPYHPVNNPLHPLNDPMHPLNQNLRGYGGVPGASVNGWGHPFGNLPPMPPGSRSYQEAPAPPPPLEEIDTPDILSAPTPPVSPTQLRRFTTQDDTGRGMTPSTGSIASGGSMSVQMLSMPGTAGTQADPSAPLSKAETMGM